MVFSLVVVIAAHLPGVLAQALVAGREHMIELWSS